MTKTTVTIPETNMGEKKNRIVSNKTIVYKHFIK